MNELDEKIARGDAGLKIAEERAARRRQLAGLVAEEQRAADVEHQPSLHYDRSGKAHGEREGKYCQKRGGPRRAEPGRG